MRTFTTHSGWSHLTRATASFVTQLDRMPKWQPQAALEQDSTCDSHSAKELHNFQISQFVVFLYFCFYFCFQFLLISCHWCYDLTLTRFIYYSNGILNYKARSLLPRCEIFICPHHPNSSCYDSISSSATRSATQSSSSPAQALSSFGVCVCVCFVVFRPSDILVNFC